MARALQNPLRRPLFRSIKTNFHSPRLWPWGYHVHYFHHRLRVTVSLLHLVHLAETTENLLIRYVFRPFSSSKQFLCTWQHFKSINQRNGGNGWMVSSSDWLYYYFSPQNTPGLKSGRGCRLRESPWNTIKLRKKTVVYEVVAYGRWSLTRSGRYERVDGSSPDLSQLTLPDDMAVRMREVLATLRQSRSQRLRSFWSAPRTGHIRPGQKQRESRGLSRGLSRQSYWKSHSPLNIGYHHPCTFPDHVTSRWSSFPASSG